MYLFGTKTRRKKVRNKSARHRAKLKNKDARRRARLAGRTKP